MARLSRICQRDLVLAGSLELGQHRLVTAALFVERRNLFGQVLRACAAACRAVLDIALVEPLEVVFQPLVGAADELSQRRAGEVAILVVDRLDAGSVDRQQLAAVQVEASAQQYELAEHGAKRRAIVAPEIGDGLEVRFQSPQQPEDLDVAMTLRLQPPARSDPVQIAVDVELQKVARRVALGLHRFRLDPQKPRRRKVQSVNEGVDEPHRIVRADIVVHRLRQHQQEAGRVPIRRGESCAILTWPMPQRNPLSASLRTVCKGSARSLGPSSIPSLGDGGMLGTAWIDRPVDTRGLHSRFHVPSVQHGCAAMPVPSATGDQASALAP